MWIKLIDFGLVILIWMTQWVVYPSFLHFSKVGLSAWHPKYTTTISFIVMPLMLLQVFLYFFSLYSSFDWLRLIGILLIGLVWVNTFFYAVPLHNQIAAGYNIEDAAGKLVQVNWYRTVLWTLVFLLNWIPLKIS